MSYFISFILYLVIGIFISLPNLFSLLDKVCGKFIVTTVSLVKHDSDSTTIPEKVHSFFFDKLITLANLRVEFEFCKQAKSLIIPAYDRRF